MLKLKGCPKCQGTLQLASDIYGRYVNCLQCGFSRDLPDALPQVKSASPIVPELQTIQRQAA